MTERWRIQYVQFHAMSLLAPRGPARPEGRLDEDGISPGAVVKVHV